MTIVVTGGGSGGHITPLLAVAAELKKQHKDARVVFVGQRGDAFARVVAENQHIDDTVLIFAGKLRRYHGEGWRQLFDIKTMLLNLRDIFLVIVGCMQSWLLVRRLNPEVVFIKGGFVGVPVGLAAAFWRIPYVTHDSDALAGLANRIIARWARVHAVALPKEVYNYPQDKTITVGVPIAREYYLVNDEQLAAYKKEIGLPAGSQLLFVTGGGLGAKVINDAMVEIAETLLRSHPRLHIVHAAGHKHSAVIGRAYEQKLPANLRNRIAVKDYIADMHKYSGAADVVVARAGATNMAELAAQGKACVIVPNPMLAGGHQLKNAQAFADAGAVVVVEQTAVARDNSHLLRAVTALLDSRTDRKAMANKLHEFAYPDAAHKLAVLLVDQIKSKKNK